MYEGTRRFGAYLKALREARRLTLGEVEHQTREDPEPLSRSLLSRLENGRARVSAIKLLALSRIYRVPFALLAERLEIEHELAAETRQAFESKPARELLAEARKSGLAGRVHRALLLYELAEARALSDADDARELSHRARVGVARALFAAGKLRLARQVVDELEAQHLEPRDAALVLYLGAQIALAVGRRLSALGSLHVLEGLPRPWPAEVEAVAPALRAQLLLDDAREEEALEAWVAALDAATRHDYPDAAIRARVKLAETERRLGRHERAASRLEEALEEAEREGLAQLRAFALLERGRLHAARGSLGEARAAFSEARRLGRELDLPVELFWGTAELWRLARERKEATEARTWLKALRRVASALDPIPTGAYDVVEALDDELFAARSASAREARS